ncbi:MAG: biotin/lipoyl-binding protein [Gammaproteobacteria bacterium]|nr:biotin/lipoyl-binding protein [Gammaproteobacteria bacterium]
MFKGRISLAIVAPVIILSLAAAIFVALMASRPGTLPLTAEKPEWPVTVQTATPGDYAPLTTLFGRTESPSETRLIATISADIQQVPVRDGNEVAQGQLLVQLDDTETRLMLAQRKAEYAEAQAQLQNETIRYRNDQDALALEENLLTLAKQEWKRAQRLQKNQLTAQTRTDETRQNVVRQTLVLEQRRLAVAEHTARQAELTARVAKAKALRGLASQNLRHSRITAPFRARVTRVTAAPGGHAQPGDSLVELYELDTLEVRAPVPNRHLPAIRAALSNQQPLTASVLPSSGTPSNSGRLPLVRLSGSVKAGSVDAIFQLPPHDNTYALGEVLKLELQLPPLHNVLALPPEAVYDSERIYRVEDQQLRTVAVQRLGVTRDAQSRERMLVRAPGLSPDELILTTQLPHAIDGLKVSIVR